MNEHIDEYKVNGNKLYLNGWVHENRYKIKVVVEEEEQYIQHYISRYDINLNFHEKIEDNQYGFQEELVFSNKIKQASVYVVLQKEEHLLLQIDERKAILFLRKIKKIFGKIKRGIRFLWREYHFLVPPTMIKKYIGMVFFKKPQVTLYNPEIESEYNSWLQRQSYMMPQDEKKFSVVSKKQEEITDEVIKNPKNFLKVLSKIKEQYILFLEGKVELVPSFNSEVEASINEGYDVIYFDNDFIKNKTYSNPIFKPDWSYDTLRGVNYIGHCFLVKKSFVASLSLTSLSGYSILLHLSPQAKVKHISKILYHDYQPIQNEKKAIDEYFQEQKIEANIKKNADGITNTVIYSSSKQPLVSIIIPTKDHADILEKCLKSIYEKTTYPNYEIIVIDNNSSEDETFKLLKEYKKKKNFKTKRLECPFNYSYINNEAVKLAKGDYILLLNNDIEVITPNWLDFMLSYAIQEHVGTVGAKLLFPDETIQHAGIIMGKGGLAGHAHYGRPRNYISPQYELKVPYNYSACTAACLMMSKKKFLQVGGLEEQLQVAFNDVDLNLKMLEQGYFNVFLPCVELYHYESKSRGLDTTAEKQKRFVQEWSFVASKWGKYIEHDPYYNDNFSKNEDYMLK